MFKGAQSAIVSFKGMIERIWRQSPQAGVHSLTPSKLVFCCTSFLSQSQRHNPQLKCPLKLRLVVVWVPLAAHVSISNSDPIPQSLTVANFGCPIRPTALFSSLQPLA